MLPYKRTNRLNILLREEVADIFIRRIKDPRLGFVTVTDVKLSEDLKIAKIFITVLKKEEQEGTLAILNEAKGGIRTELAKRIRMKFIPSLEFNIDPSSEDGYKIDQLLNKIKQQKPEKN